MMVLNKAHTQEEFIRGSMTKNPYSSLEIGPLMRDVKNKICRQLELLGLVEDDYGMELPDGSWKYHCLRPKCSSGTVSGSSLSFMCFLM